jgi:GDP-L-fucose synthase
MFFRDQRVLVTGAAGLVGSHLLRALHAQGAQVRATFHRRRPPLLDGIDYCMGADLINRNVCDEVVRDIDYVFLCAASTSGAAAIHATPLIHVTPNIIMNAQMLEAAYLAGVKKVMYIGSTTGYPVTGRPYREEDMFHGDPWDKYFPAGWMKRYTEILCRMYTEKLPRSMPGLVLRATNIYGPGDKFDPERSHFLPALIRRVVERQDPIVVWGTGDDLRDLIYVDDMVEAMLLAMETLDRFEPLNIGAGVSRSIKEVLALLLKVEEYEHVKVVFDPTKPSTVPRQVVDCSKAERVLGFKAKVGLEDGIRRTVSWYRSQLKQG